MLILYKDFTPINQLKSNSTNEHLIKIKKFMKSVPFLEPILSYRKNKIDEARKRKLILAEIHKAENKEPFHPTVVFIETINRCNNSCPFCPANKLNDRRDFALMKEELFKKILQDLSDMSYKGAIALSLNNEPLLDSRIVDLCELVRNKFPNNILYLYTNGLLLTEQIFLSLMKYLDEIYIDNYNDEYKFIAPIKKIYEYVKQHEGLFERKKINIFLRKFHDTLSTRAGQSPNNPGSETLHNRYGCVAPYRQIAIRPMGEISLCCSDAMGDMTLGDVNKEHLSDIWNGKAFKEIRKVLRHKRDDISLCKKCDFVWF